MKNRIIYFSILVSLFSAQSNAQFDAKTNSQTNAQSNEQSGAQIEPILDSQSEAQANSIKSLKAEIVALASSYQGQGDPDFSKQKSLEPLVKKLLQASPQKPVKDRISLIVGAWKQVWGPYDYRNDKRGVDPQLGVREIYQVVSKDGYYYNVSPLYKNGDKNNERIGLLRGEYKLDPTRSTILTVKFTKYPGLSKRPSNLKLWELPALAEKGTLENQITIVPTLFVKLFFTGGNLREVYTDSDLRILYGSNNQNFSNEALYIMTRVK